jgi:Leishmanolysin
VLLLSALAILTACPLNTGGDNPPPPPDSSRYNITVLFDNSVPEKYEAAFQGAANRWQQIITGELPDVANVKLFEVCAPEVVVAGTVTVDDVAILVGTFTEGPNGTLGFAGPCGTRVSNGLTAVGLMKFDTADMDILLEEGQLDETIIHEMGHVLGIGTLWDSKGLTSGISTTQGQCGANPRYIGTKGVAEYTALGGPDATVPLEDKFGPGSCEGHWRESVFNTELMTSFLDSIPPSVPNPLSKLSIASLEDLGYTVSYTSAEAYTLSLLPDLIPQATLEPHGLHSELIEPTVIFDDLPR